MTIPDNPAGDDNGNQQGQAGSAEQDKWERIIQHFADGVYESTNGGHTIRRVRIYRSGKNASNADIVWGEAGHPQVNTGVGEVGGHICMYKTFTNGTKNNLGIMVDKAMLADEKGSGYTMAHEWGHYFYGLYDEYKRDSTPQGVVAVAPAIMSSQWNALGGDFRWLNFSIAKQSGAAAGGPFQNTEATDQHDIHKASCWETLKRTVDKDVRTASELPLGRRIYYGEVASRGPTGSNTPMLDLPTASARAQLDIIWMKDEVALQIVIDNSGSMDGTPIEQARLAAKLVVDRATIGSTRIGVIKFNSTVTIVKSLAPVSSAADKTAIKAAIDTITATGNTAIGDAAAAALTPLTTAPIGTNMARAVFLLSDGISNTGQSPLAVIPTYKQAQVPLFTFGFGTGADTATLGQMADQTGGRYYSSPTTLAAIVQVFDDAFGKFVETPKVSEGGGSPAAGSSSFASFDVDSSMSRMQTSFTFNRNVTGDQVTLRAPNGSEYAAVVTGQTGGEKLLYLDILNPVAGRWQIVTTTASAGSRLDYQASAVPTGATFTQALTTSDGATTVSYPAAVVLRTKVDRSRRVAGMTVTGRVINPDRTESTVTFSDNGVGDDRVAGDGIYTAVFRYRQNGVHQFFATCENRNGSARYTSVGSTQCPFAGSAGDNGQPVTPLPDVLVGEAFSRSASLQVTTSGGVFSDSRVVNLSVRTPVGTGSQTLIVGFVITGSGTKTLLLRGLGPALIPLGVTNAIADPRMRLLGSNGSELDANNDWGGSAALAANFTAVGASGLPAASKDAALLKALPTGLYSFHVLAATTGTGVALAELYDADAIAGSASLVNISARTQVGTGENILIAGFVITGNGSKTLLIRGLGPALVPAGVTGVLSDPVLYLYGGSTLITSNDDWGGTAALKSAFATVGAGGLVSDASYDSALLVNLLPGVYSAQVSGFNGSTGVGLVEIFLMP